PPPLNVSIAQLSPLERVCAHQMCRRALRNRLDWRRRRRETCGNGVTEVGKDGATSRGDLSRREMKQLDAMLGAEPVLAFEVEFLRVDLGRHSSAAPPGIDDAQQRAVRREQSDVVLRA